MKLRKRNLWKLEIIKCIPIHVPNQLFSVRLKLKRLSVKNLQTQNYNNKLNTRYYFWELKQLTNHFHKRTVDKWKNVWNPLHKYQLFKVFGSQLIFHDYNRHCLKMETSTSRIFDNFQKLFPVSLTFGIRWTFQAFDERRIRTHLQTWQSHN